MDYYDDADDDEQPNHSGELIILVRVLEGLREGAKEAAWFSR